MYNSVIGTCTTIITGQIISLLTGSFRSFSVFRPSAAKPGRPCCLCNIPLLDIASSTQDQLIRRPLNPISPFQFLTNCVAVCQHTGDARRQRRLVPCLRRYEKKHNLETQTQVAAGLALTTCEATSLVTFQDHNKANSPEEPNSLHEENSTEKFDQSSPYLTFVNDLHENTPL